MLPQLGARIAATPGLGAPARFAQRQVHGATGWMPHGGGASIGLDASGGATSLPDLVRGLAKDPKGTLQKGLHAQWHNQGTGGKMLTALSAAEIPVAALSDDQPGGPGRGERIGRSVMRTGAGLATGSLPWTAQMAVQGVLGGVGAGAGRLVDKVRGHGGIPAAVPPPYSHDDGPAGEVRVGPGMMPAGGSGGGM